MIKYRAPVGTGRPSTTVLTLLTVIAVLLGGSLASSPPAAAATDHQVQWRYDRTDTASVRASNYQTMITNLRDTARSYRGSMYRTGTGNTEIVVALGNQEHLSLYFSAENMYFIGFRSQAEGAPAYAFAEHVARVGEFTDVVQPRALPMRSDYPALQRVAEVGRAGLATTRSRYSPHSATSAPTPGAETAASPMRSWPVPYSRSPR